MNLFKRKRPVEEQGELPQSEEISWEEDIRTNLRRSERTAWRCAGAAFFFAMLCILAIVFMLPLKRVVPYVVTVDKVTGDASLVSTAETFAKQNVMQDKHWLRQFVIARERYDYPFLQGDYDTVQRLADASVFQEYDRRFEGPSALDKKFGAALRILPTVLSIQISSPGVAMVRYELRTSNSQEGRSVALSRGIATVRYEYRVPARARESELIENPLGFQVLAYRTDAELLATESRSDGGAP